MRIHASILCLLTFLAAASAAAEPVILKFQMEPGEIQAYQISLNMKMDVKGSGGKSFGTGNMDMSIDMGFALKCLTADENELTCEVQFYSPQIDLNMLMQGQKVRISMDSSGLKVYQGSSMMRSIRWSEMNDPNMPNITDLMKIKLRCRFGRNGELLEILNNDQLSNITPGYDYSNMLGQQVVFPDHPVEIGESWEVESKMDFQGGMNTGIEIGKLNNRCTYVLKKVGDYKGARCAFISVEGTSATGDDNAEISLEQTIKGSVVVEIGTGRLMYAKVYSEQEMAGYIGGSEIGVNGETDLIVRYKGGQLPKEAVQEDLMARIEPSLLKALSKIRAPIILDDKIKIGKQFYRKKEVVDIEGRDLRLIKFTDDKLYLKDESTGIIYKIVMNYRGEVMNIKPIVGKQG